MKTLPHQENLWGKFWLWKSAKSVIKSKRNGFVGAKTVGCSHSQFHLVIS